MGAMMSIRSLSSGLSLSMVIIATAIAAGLSLSTGNKAMDDTKSAGDNGVAATRTAGEDGVDKCFQGGTTNVENMAAQMMDKTVSDVDSRIQGFLRVPRLAADAVMNFLSKRPATDLNSTQFLTTQLRAQIAANFETGQPFGLSEVAVFMAEPQSPWVDDRPKLEGCPCEDDPTGKIANAGATCSMLEGIIGCDGDENTINPAEPVGSLLKLDCPNLCGACPAATAECKDDWDGGLQAAGVNCPMIVGMLPGGCATGDMKVLMPTLPEGSLIKYQCPEFCNACPGKCVDDADGGLQAAGVSCGMVVGMLPGGCATGDMKVLMPTLPTGSLIKYQCPEYCGICPAETCHYPRCIDDWTGGIAAQGVSCELLIGMITCDGDMKNLNPTLPTGSLLKQVCPVSCNACGQHAGPPPAWAVRHLKAKLRRARVLSSNLPQPARPEGAARRRTDPAAVKAYKVFRGRCGGEAKYNAENNLECGERCVNEDNDRVVFRCCSDAMRHGWVEPVGGTTRVGQDPGWNCVNSSSAQQGLEPHVFAESEVTLSDTNKAGGGTVMSCGQGTYAEGKAHCEAAGGRLCTAEEARRGCPEGTGCQFDYQVYWTSDEGCAQGLQPVGEEDWCTDDPTGGLQALGTECYTAVGLLGCDGYLDLMTKSIGETLCWHFCGKCPGQSGSMDKFPTPGPRQDPWVLIHLYESDQSAGTAAHKTHKLLVLEKFPGSDMGIGGINVNTSGTIRTDLKCSVNDLFFKGADVTAGRCLMGEMGYLSLESTMANRTMTQGTPGTMSWGDVTLSSSRTLVLPYGGAIGHADAPPHPIYGSRIGMVWASPSVNGLSGLLRLGMDLMEDTRMYLVGKSSTGFADTLLATSHGLPFTIGRSDLPSIALQDTRKPEEATDLAIREHAKLVRSRPLQYDGFDPAVMHRWTGPRIFPSDCQNHDTTYVPPTTGGNPLSLYVGDSGAVLQSALVLAEMNSDWDAFCDGMVDAYEGCAADLGPLWSSDLDANGHLIAKGTKLAMVCPASCGVCERNVTNVEYWVKIKSVVIDDLTLYAVMLVVRDVAMARIDEATRKVQDDIAAAMVRVQRDIDAANKKVNEDKDESFMIMVIVLVVCVILLLVLSISFAFAITAPLLVLADQMAGAASMDLDNIDTKATPSSLAELKTMQKSFFQMIVNLKEFRNYMPQSLLINNEDDEEEQVDTSGLQKVLSEEQSGAGSAVGSKKEGGLTRQNSQFSRTSKASRSQHQTLNTRRAKADAALQKAAEGVKTKKCSFLVLNMRGFLQQKCSDSALLKLHGDTIAAIMQESAKNKGVPDTFCGDRILVSYSAVRPNVQHAKAAVTTADACCAEEKSTRGAVCTTSSTKVGNIGCAGMKKFSFIGVGVTWVYGLERFAKTIGVDVIADPAASEEAKTQNYMLVAELLTFEKKDSKAHRVFQVGGKKQVSEDEWMYQLEEGQKMDPAALWNECMGAILHGEWGDAKAKLDEAVAKVTQEPLKAPDPVVAAMRERVEKKDNRPVQLLFH